jgi:hypothetical protein
MLCPRCSEDEWPSWPPSPIEVSMSSVEPTPTKASRPMVSGPVWI